MNWQASHAPRERAFQRTRKLDHLTWAKPEKVGLNYSEIIGVPIAMLLVGLCLLGWAVIG